MKKLAEMFEDLWVAVTFAEAGVSEGSLGIDPGQRCHQDAACCGTA
jgi:hypothetical protein